MSAEQEIGALLTAGRLTLATAESCTGGLVGHRLTDVPGSSAYFVGGFVAYSYEAKELLLGVQRETLVKYGAVSEQTAREMARGARLRLATDIGIGITGIAGPTGATPEKPVGLVYIALSAVDAELCERHVWQGDRPANKSQSAEAALQLLLSYLHLQSVPAADMPPPPSGSEKPMIEFIDEMVSVELLPGKGRNVRPLAFHWRGRRYPIESWGRGSSRTKKGRTVHCHLVQTAGPETWELCQDTETAQWTLTRHWAVKSTLV